MQRVSGWEHRRSYDFCANRISSCSFDFTPLLHIGHRGARQIITGGCHDSSKLFVALPAGARTRVCNACIHRDGIADQLFNSVGQALGAEMPAVGWMRRWRSARGGADEQARAPVLAAARGEPLGQLLNLGARALLSAAGADRAGLWLSGDRKGESGIGSVTEAVPGPIPEEWKRLDVSTPFLRAALESVDPLHVEFIAGDTTPHLGPLIGMHSAVWIPLRDRGRTFGLAMVGYARPPGPLDLDALRARADEISLAVQHHRSSRRSELASEELRAQSRLSRAILCGVSADSILPQIARAARHYCPGGIRSCGPWKRASLCREKDGMAPRWLAILHQETLLQLWRSVLEEGRESEISGASAARSFPPRSTEDSPGPGPCRGHPD